MQEDRQQPAGNSQQIGSPSALIEPQPSKPAVQPAAQQPPVDEPTPSDQPPAGAATPAAPAGTVQLPADVAALTPEVLKSLRARLEEAREKHKIRIDSVMFNGGTVGVLLLTAAAAFLPSVVPERSKWVAQLCSAVAAFWVATERALGFGARWRYHREMYYAYDAIIDMLDFSPLVPPSEQPKYVRDIFAALYAVRSRESAIPNAGTNTAPT